MPPLCVLIKPASGLCDLRCSYCFYSDVTAHRAVASYGVMTEETLDTLLRRAFAYAEGQLTLMFQGGEPTVAGKDFYRRLLQLERRYQKPGLRVQHVIQTNGYRLDAEWCEIFREGSFLVGVSLDGTEALHDACRRTPEGEPTYRRICENLALLREAGVEYNILCVVTGRIAQEGRAVFSALQPHRYLQFIPCLDGLDGEPAPDPLTAEGYGQFLVDTFDCYERAWRAGKPVSERSFDNWIGMLLGRPPESCGMSGRCGHYFLVEADGGVYPCDFYVLDRWKLGNIHTDSFFRLAASPLGQRFCAESVPLPQECRACRWLPLCRGGCKREREPIIGGVPSQHRLCAGLRRFFAERGDRLAALAQQAVRQHRR